MNQKFLLLFALLLLFPMISLKAMKTEGSLNLSDNEETEEKNYDEESYGESSSSSESDDEMTDEEGSDLNSSGSQSSVETNSLLEFVKRKSRKQRHSYMKQVSDSSSSNSADDDTAYDESFEIIANKTSHSQSVQSSFLADWAFPLTITAATALYCVVRPKLIQESWEYIKDIPIPFPLVSLGLAGGYIAFRTMQQSKKNVSENDGNNVGLVVLLNKLQDCQEHHNLLAIKSYITETEVNRKYEKVKKEQKALKRKCNYFEQKIKLLEKQQKNFFVLDESKTAISPQTERRSED